MDGRFGPYLAKCSFFFFFLWARSGKAQRKGVVLFLLGNFLDGFAQL